MTSGFLPFLLIPFHFLLPTLLKRKKAVTYDRVMEQHLLRDSCGEILPQFRQWVVGSKYGSPLHEQKRAKSDDGLLDFIFYKVLGSDYKRPRCQIGSSESLHHYANLFVWSVLAGKFGFSLFLLEQPPLKYPMAAALVACNILRKTVKAQ